LSPRGILKTNKRKRPHNSTDEALKITLSQQKYGSEYNAGRLVLGFGEVH